MILPPFFGYKTPSNDGEPYRIHYSYLGEDAFTYDEYPKSVNKHTYIGADVVTYKIKYLPPLLIYTYLSQDVLTYQTLTKNVIVSYAGLDCLSFQKRYPPEAPFDILAVPGNSEAYLSWSAPESYGLPIQDYIIKYTLANPYAILTENDSILRAENGEPLTLENSQLFSENWILVKDKRNPLTNITVTGLVNNNTYSFKVAAINAAGRGKYGYSNNATPQISYTTTTTTAAPSGAFTLSGAGTSAVDGCYSQAGMHNGMPYYSNGTYFVWYEGFEFSWFISQSVGGGPPDYIGSNENDVPSSWSEATGSSPAPTLSNGC
jgi:hypothetical protein